MSFDTALKTWLDRLAREGGAAGLDAAARALREASHHTISALDGERFEVADVRELAIPVGGDVIRARAYTPFAAGVAPGPGVVFLHGGGFVIGDLDTHDHLCRRLAGASRCRLLAVDYRRAPEHRFPTAVEDALAAYDWATGDGAEEWGADRERLAVAGDSAGGNLAATVALERRSGPARVRLQVLIYPLVQLMQTNSEKLRLLEGHLLSQHIWENVQAAYLRSPDDASHPWASPLARDDLAGAPPAYVVTARLDPLHDEGRAFADRLAAAGVAVELRHHKTAIHGFFQMTGVSGDARRAVDDAGAALGRALGAPVETAA